jgi:RNA polymerase sigma factor for flagellar operon FliA
MNAAVHLYQSNCDQLQNRNALVLAHQGMVRRVAIHLRTRVPSFIDLDELIQVGMIGLIEASESYDPVKGIEFDHFAHARVRGAMLDEVRRLSVLPRSAVTFNREVSAAKQNLANQLGRLPSEGEVAQYLGKSMVEYNHEQSQAHSYQTHSIEDVSEEALSVASSAELRPDSILESNQIKELIIDLIEELPEREKLILSLYYVDELNLKEIAAVLEVGESRVSQILTGTIKKLRARLQLN